MAQKKIVQTAGRTQLGEFAPEFARLNDDILFGEVWSRNDLLSLRDPALSLSPHSSVRASPTHRSPTTCRRQRRTASQERK